jgi:polysaccharide export outer membrane protein
MPRFAFVQILMTLVIAGCTSGAVVEESRRIAFSAQPASEEAQVEPHRLQNGDTISIKFVNNPEMNLEAPVRPDGKISISLIGEVHVTGLTVPDLRSLISRQLKAFVEKTGYGEVLKEGDELQMRQVFNPELNQTLIVRPDGKISLPLVGEVQAAGVSPSDLRAQLTELYAKHLKKPDVALLTGPNVTKKVFTEEPFILVGLSRVSDRLVFVGGEVLTPKGVKFEGQLTALQAIMQAGGVKETGDLAKVIVLRRGEHEQAEWIQTNLANPLSGTSLQNDVRLHHGDVVLIPRSGIAQVNLWVKQYIRDVLPLQSSFNATTILYDAGGVGR